MPRYNVHHPKTNQWACYSTICDDFITEWMDEDKYDIWRKAQYGEHYCSIYEANQMTLEEALRRRG